MEQNINEGIENGSATIAIDLKKMIDHSKVELISQSNHLISNNYLSTFFLWLLTWFFIILSFIWIIDPYGVSPLQVNLPGINTYKNKRLDIDRLIKPYEVWRYQPKTIFLGTSRIQESMDPAVLDGTDFAPAYNAAIPACNLSENVANIEQYLKLNPNIKHIFLELFLYNFTTPVKEEASKSSTEFLLNLGALQISHDALRDAIQTIITNIQNNSIPAHIEKLGFRVQDSTFNPIYTFSEELNIKTVLSWNRAGKLQLQESAFDALDRIVSLTHQHGVQLHLIVTPNYPWDDYRLLTLGYWPMLEEWLRRIAKYQNVVSFSQYNSLLEEHPVANPPMKWWNDPTHFSLNMGKMILTNYLGHPLKGTPSNFMQPVNQKTVASIIKKRHAGILHWASSTANAHYVTLFENEKWK